MKYSIIIPCYNESDNISWLVERLRLICTKYDVEFLLVENGSVDNSRAVMEAEPLIDGQHIRAVYVEQNRGYGYGLLQGTANAEGDYVGWLHADLQVPVEALEEYFEFLETRSSDERFFLKGRRKNRSLFDRLFTFGQSAFNTMLFRQKLYDVGAIPVLFHRSLLNEFARAPYDFSIELFVYHKALQNGYTVRRYPVDMQKRSRGKSSWNTGLRSKLRQSRRIFKDSIAIKKGEQVL
ncbi:glycosyltransferase family 2 protein [Ruminococcaceae bacterium OttesenSCG-928-I18]|nr:glycosyltransferase family 2 protein [Ruminococcaceae bacterium OttesenSCG-928-I18]